MAQRTRILAVAAVLWLLSGWLPAGVSSAQAADEKDLITQAYELTQNAQTLADFTRVIDLCTEALKGDVSKTQADYARKLMAWAYNRRGEANADRAGSLAAAGKVDAAAELDSSALADFEAAITNDPSRWRAIHNRGVSYALVGKYDEAIDDFNRTIELNPAYSNAWFNRAEIRYEQGKFREGIEDYTEAIRLKPEDAEAFNRRGHARYRLGQYQQALADYSNAVRLDDNNAEAYANRADAYADLGDWDNAARDYRMALRLNDALGRAYQGAAWLMATCPDARFRNPRLALDAAEKAVQLDGKSDYRYLDTLAAAQANNSQFEEAAKTQQAAIEVAPGDAGDRLRARLALYEAGMAYREAARQTNRP